MKIAFDLDGVLANSYEAFMAYMNQHGQPDWRTEDMKSLDFSESFGVTNNYIDDMFIAFFNNDVYQVDPIKGSIEATDQLRRNGHHLSIITHRDTATHHKTMDWVRKHYGNTFDSINIMGNEKNKGEVCTVLDLEMLIDDKPENVQDATNHNITGVLFNQPYNQKAKLPRVEGYKNLQRYITKLCAYEARKKL